MIEVWEYRDSELNQNQAFAIVTLLHEVWPHPNKTLLEMAASFSENRREAPNEIIRFIVWDGTKAIAHAKTFSRNILTTKGELKIMALAEVCVARNRRGKGLGEAVVRKAFKHVDCGSFPVSLFQTAVPVFYQKLGAKRICNPFIDGKNREKLKRNPWWEPHIMIYPAQAQWPCGLVDLNGPGY